MEALTVCGVADGVRMFPTGMRCPSHTPAALAGRPEVVVDPELTAAALFARRGIKHGFQRSDSSLIDDRAVASGRRRSNSAEYRAAQKAEHSRRLGELARRRK